ncbi:MAG: hypothetical protein J5858_09235 [Lentisphaeria bacterium]|nr:hypothetical protein [Lentisphaeria bacterium]
MKSAYELALERTGGKLNELPTEKKEKIAEIDRIYKSRIAAAELSAQQKLAKENDPEKAEELRQGLITEIASLRDQSEREKAAVRKS